LYKASAGNTQWDTLTAKQITVVVKTVFYKTIWFWVLIALFSATILFIIYQYRLRQQKEVFMLKEKAQLLEKEKALVMYENLKQQLNPHFLFNSLTSLSSLIRLDQEIAGNFLDKMSKVYRYILKNRDNETVPLGEELKFVQLYIDLQKTRFEKGLIVNVNIDGEYHHRKIAPVTLQNLVENAIKHNTADPEAPLIIDLFIQDDYLVVRNNLQRKNFVETSNKQGLANMESLYHYLSDRPMEIREDEKFFTIKIPLI
jgi:LytS/YehU family sensor histidine kinase